MTLFTEIPDAQVVLRSKGVYRQVKLFAKGDQVFAAWGSGFIRLLKHSGTTVPTVTWQVDDLYDPGATIMLVGGLPTVAG